MIHLKKKKLRCNFFFSLYYKLYFIDDTLLYVFVFFSHTRNSIPQQAFVQLHGTFINLEHIVYLLVGN